jgi:hypothetical protein
MSPAFMTNDRRLRDDRVRAPIAARAGMPTRTAVPKMSCWFA